MDDNEQYINGEWDPRVLLHSTNNDTYLPGPLCTAMWICLVSLRGVTSALSDENISGRHNAGKGVGDASSHRHTDAGSKSSTFQEDLMRLINPDSTFSEKEQTLKVYLREHVVNRVHSDPKCS